MNANLVVILSFLNIFLTNLYSIKCATFENINVVLTTTQKVEGDLDLRDPNWVAPTKSVSIQSDDKLSKYIKDEKDLTIVEFKKQQLPKLTHDSITDLPNAEELRVNFCGLKEIEPGSFKNLPKLTTMNFDDNDLTVIKNGVFTGLEVDSLSFENNKIATIEDRAFNNLKLKYLYLQHNQITKWNSDWFNGSPLYAIFISHNLIEQLPKNSFKFLSDGIKPVTPKTEEEFDSQMSKTDFFVVDFSSNRIKTIQSGAFYSIGSLEDLILNNNELERLQSGVFSGIKYSGGIQLNNNKISNIEVDIFGKDARITSIGLENNKLSSFPLKLLKTIVAYLRIDHNPVSCQWIESIEEWMSNKTGDYFHEYFSPAVPRLEEIKPTCVH